MGVRLTGLTLHTTIVGDRETLDLSDDKQLYFMYLVSTKERIYDVGCDPGGEVGRPEGAAASATMQLGVAQSGPRAETSSADLGFRLQRV